uniref:Uncharacterized protein n=1 Tax=uncultured Elusimicrobia bacterium TaxID=699876 RepID=A0A650EMS2_9BACT|nr:hypothetical protein Elusimicrob1349_0710 [uncultured Elusimicrobia bacterium]
MKKLLLLLVLGLFSCSAFAQSAYKIVQTGKAIRRLKASVVARTLQAPASQVALAKATSELRSPRYLHTARINPKIAQVRVPQVVINTDFLVPKLGNPANIYGGYNYLKTITKLARKPQTVEPAYARMWNLIANDHAYKGAHNIVNKSTLKIIYEDMTEKYALAGKIFPVNLTEMQNNAPGIFHILHGNPHYQRVFHNAERQTAIYYEYGMKAVIEDFFETINRLSAESGGAVPGIPPSVMIGTYMEAELWCKTFHLRWE